MTQTILVVEDDAKIRTLLRNVLEGEGFAVVEAASAREVRARVENDAFCLVTMDLHLGQDDGLELARWIRSRSEVPIVMVTGKGDVIDRVVGLEIGADDYITKPFHLREVVARIRSVLRRSGAPAPLAQPPVEGRAEIYRFDGMEAVPSRMELFGRDGTPCHLTSGDFRLLTFFLQRPKRILSRDQLVQLWGGQSWSPTDRSVDNQIARLRKKIERQPSDPALIKTVRGLGYMFASEVERVQSSDSSGESS